jgi:hypothetical protein
VIARRWSALSVAGLALAALSGCGSTVQDTGSALSSDAALGVPGAVATTGPSGGLTVPGSTTGTTGPGGTTVPGSTVTGPGGTVPGSTSTAPGASTQPGQPVATGPGGTAAQSVPGVTKDAVYVGVVYTVNGDQANAALGASNITQGDTKADARAVIDQINATGGVAGRKLVPVWHAFDAESTDTYADQDQQECADFTQDNHIFVSIDSGLTDTFQQCMQKNNIPIVWAGSLIGHNDAFYQQHPQFFDIGTMSGEAYMGAEVQSLLRQHYFTGWNQTLGQPSAGTPPKIGILGDDDPIWIQPEQDTLLPALRQAGYPVAAQDVINVSNPNSTADDTKTINDISNAELKFAQDGVTHVIMLDANGSLTLFFANAARSQHYYPRYGINSGTGAEALSEGSEVGAAQLNGAVGFGWEPSIDLPAAAGNKYATAATKNCLQIMKKRTGQTYTSTNAASLALGYCDQLFMVRDAIDQAAKNLNPATFSAAMASMGTHFPSAGLPQIDLTPQRHYGAVLGWDMFWNPSCGQSGCIQYRPGAHRVP